MERHEILEAMSELKLYGMRASFDEVAGKGLARRDEIYPLIASLIRAERTHRQARSISYRIGGAKFPVLKDLDKFVFADTPVDEGQVRELATGTFLDAKRNAIFIGGTGTRETPLCLPLASPATRPPPPRPSLTPVTPAPHPPPPTATPRIPRSYPRGGPGPSRGRPRQRNGSRGVGRGSLLCTTWISLIVQGGRNWTRRWGRYSKRFDNLMVSPACEPTSGLCRYAAFLPVPWAPAVRWGRFF